MTLITKAVTHFRATFEKVLHFRTGARAPILWKSQIWANENDYHLERPGGQMRIVIITIPPWRPNENESHLEKPGHKKTQMRLIIIWVYWLVWL